MGDAELLGISIQKGRAQNSTPESLERSQRVAKLGLAHFQPQVQQKIDGLSPAARQHWQKNEPGLKAMATDGKDYRKHITSHPFYPESVRKELIAVCEMLELSARFGRATAAFVEGKKEDIGTFSEQHQTNIVRMASMARAFATEYAKKKGIEFGSAWHTLIKDDNFVRFLASDKPDLESEARIRRNYGLSTDSGERLAHLETAHSFVADQARQAGFSENSISVASKSLGVRYKQPKSATVPSSIARAVDLAIRDQERQRKEREKQLREIASKRAREGRRKGA